jgi:TorA maturation chaperone TorD
MERKELVEKLEKELESLQELRDDFKQHATGVNQQQNNPDLIAVTSKLTDYLIEIEEYLNNFKKFI